MAHPTPQQIANDYVKAQYEKFSRYYPPPPCIPNPLPAGWIDLASIPVHPGHARALKRMIFESQHPDLFDYREELLTFAFVRDLPPPGVNPAHYVLPPQEWRTDTLIRRYPKLRPATVNQAESVVQPAASVAPQAAPAAQQSQIVFHRAAPVAPPSPITQQAIPGRNEAAVQFQDSIQSSTTQQVPPQSLNSAQPSPGSQKGVAQSLDPFQAYSGSQQDAVQSLCSTRLSSENRRDTSQQVGTAPQQDIEWPSHEAAKKLKPKRKLAEVIDPNSFGNSSGYIGSERQFAKRLKEMEAASKSKSPSQNQQMFQAACKSFGQNEQMAQVVDYVSPYGPRPSTSNGQPPTPHFPGSQEKRRTPPHQSDRSPPERKKKKPSWTEDETNCVEQILRDIRAEEEAAGISKEETKKWKELYEEASKRLFTNYGIDRTWSAIKNHWSRDAREITGFDERYKQNSDMLATSIQKPKNNK